MQDLIEAVLSALLHLVVVAVVLTPLIWWRARRGGYRALASGAGRALLQVATIYVSLAAVWNLPRVGFLADLAWNWQNKLLVLALVILLVSLAPSLSWRDVGVRKPRRGWWAPVAGISVLWVGVMLLGEPQFEVVDAETVAFQAIVPGLDEELLFRGVLLVLLTRALGAPRSMWRGQVGWEVPITCLLFGLVHALVVTGTGVTFDAPSFLFTGLLGLVLVWIRVRWNSLWPALLAHNGINSAAVAASAIMLA